MDTNVVAPIPTPVMPDAPAPRAALQDTGARPFERALKQELAKPETARVADEKMDTNEAASAPSQPVKAETGKTETEPAPLRESAPLPEWAALLESAGLRDNELVISTETAQGKELHDPSLLADTRATDLTPLPSLALIVPPPARPADSEAKPAADALIAAVTDRKSGAQDARATDTSRAEELPTSAQSTSTDVLFESAVSAFGGDRFAGIEAQGTTLHAASTLDNLSAGVIGARWASAQSIHAEAAPGQTATARIDTPFGESGWSDAFQQKVVWLVDRQQQSAELHVNPPHLGPVDVLLSLADDGAQIAFTSPHAAVREAIEASLADLRTALSDKGMTLGETLVSADSRQAREQLAEGRQSGPRESSGSGEIAVEISPRPVQRGLVDLFA